MKRRKKKKLTLTRRTGKKKKQPLPPAAAHSQRKSCEAPHAAAACPALFPRLPARRCALFAQRCAGALSAELRPGRDAGVLPVRAPDSRRVLLCLLGRAGGLSLFFSPGL